MRGKIAVAALAIFGGGITPAYAGKSSGSVRSRLGLGDHPRVCGEKFASIIQAADTGGSPPRMRGKADENFYRRH